MRSFIKTHFTRRGYALTGTIYIMNGARPTIYHKTVTLSRSLSESKAKSLMVKAALDQAKRKTSSLAHIMPPLGRTTGRTIKAISKTIRSAEKQRPSAISKLMKLRQLALKDERAKRLALATALMVKARRHATSLTSRIPKPSRRVLDVARTEKLRKASMAKKVARRLPSKVSGEIGFDALSNYIGCGSCLS